MANSTQLDTRALWKWQHKLMTPRVLLEAVAAALSKLECSGSQICGPVQCSESVVPPLLTFWLAYTTWGLMATRNCHWLPFGPSVHKMLLYLPQTLVVFLHSLPAHASPGRYRHFGHFFQTFSATLPHQMPFL